MSDQIKQIAQRLREIREISGISAEAAAAGTGVSVEQYIAYESGGIDLPMSFMYEAANLFKIDLLAIINGDMPRLRTMNVVRKDKGVSVERRKEYKYQSLAYNFAGRKAEPFMVTLSPEKESEPMSLNTHPGQEFNYIIDGSVKIFVGGHEAVLHEGDSVYFDSSLQHGMKTVGGKPARFLAVIL